MGRQISREQESSEELTGGMIIVTKKHLLSDKIFDEEKKEGRLST